MRKKLLLSLVAAVCCLCAWGEDYPENNQIWYTTNGDPISNDIFSEYFEVEVDQSQLEDGTWVVTFPNEVESIPSDVFSDNEDLTSVTIPASVNELDGSFYNCCSLTTVTFAPNSNLTRLGNSVFTKTAINSITLPSGVEVIDESAFEECSNLTSITLPANVTNIGSMAFFSCNSLGTVTFAPESELESIGENAFKSCSGLGSITLPASVTTIGESAFEGAGGWGASLTFESGSKMTEISNKVFSHSQFSSIVLPEGLVSIADEAFYKSSISSIVIPKSVTSIGNSAFNYASLDYGLTFADGIDLKKISDHAFASTNIPSVIIPASVTSIGEGAFSDCGNLASVTIPEGVTEIGNEAFCGCFNLIDITLNTTTMPVCGEGVWEGISTDPKPALHVPASILDDCIAAGWWDKFDDMTVHKLIVSNVGWASLYLPYAVTIPSGMKVYYASAVSDATVTLTEITDVIPAETGVIVKADADTYEFDCADPNTSGVTGNLFDGKTEESSFEANSVYVLSPESTSDSPIFQNYAGETLGAFKAYLPKSNVPSGSNTLRFVFDDATGIKSISADTDTDLIYNMAGQRVSSDYRGIVIKNGKKTWNN